VTRGSGEEQTERNHAAKKEVIGHDEEKQK
jgi:hypothetical protein